MAEPTAADVKPTPPYNEGPTDKADALPFVKICEQFAKMSKVRTKNKRVQTIFTPELYKYLDNQTVFPIMRLLLPSVDRERVYGLKVDKLCDIYIRCLLGSKDKNNPFAQRILRWKDPAAANQISAAVGDFSTVLRDVLVHRGYSKLGDSIRNQHKREQNLTVGELNQQLDRLASAAGAKDNKTADQVRQEVFYYFLKRCNAEEIFWITRIILKDLKVKLQHESVLGYVHPQAVEAFNIHMDLRRLCAELRDRSVTMVQQIQLFDVCKPMLAKRMVPEMATVGMASFGMELKLDGERMIVHIDKERKNGPKVMFFTRNGNNYTDKYGAALIPSIVRNVRCKRCILDGEVVAFDKSTGEFIPFGQNRTVGNLARAAQANAFGNDNYLEQQGQHLCYMVFDIMFIQGEEKPIPMGPTSPGCITQLPLSKRREILIHVTTPKPTYFEVLPQDVVTTQNKATRTRLVIEALDQAILNRQEGLVIKNTDSKYELGKRNTNWVKLKPEYVDGLGDDLDIIVLGGYYGEGMRRSGDVSHFLLGLADSQHKVDGSPTKYYTFCKVGTGYSLQELSVLRKRLSPHWKKWDPKNLPAHFSDWKIMQKKHIPNVWIEPQHSILFQVTGAELTESDAFAARYTVRFPRVVCIRSDKSVDDCMTYSDLQSLLADRKGGIHGNSGGTRSSTQTQSQITFGVEVASQSSTKRQQKRKRQGAGGPLARKQVGVHGVLNTFKPVLLNSSDGVKLSSVFSGLEIAVLPVKTKMEPISISWSGENVELHDKQSVEKFIQRCGGSVIGDARASTDFVVAPGTGGLKYNNVIKFGARDVLTPRFLVDCVQQGQVPTLPDFRFYLFMCSDTRERLGKLLDAYGDHYMSHADEHTFHNLLAEIEQRWKSTQPVAFEQQPTPEQWDSLLKDECDPLLTRFTMFRGAVAYFDRYDCVRLRDSDASKLVDTFGEVEVAMRAFKLYGGRVASYMEPGISFVVVDATETSRLDSLRSTLRTWRIEKSGEERAVKRIVTTDWVYHIVSTREAWNATPPDESKGHVVAL